MGVFTVSETSTPPVASSCSSNLTFRDFLEDEPVDPVRLAKSLKLKRRIAYEEAWDRIWEEIGREILFPLRVGRLEPLLALRRALDP